MKKTISINQNDLDDNLSQEIEKFGSPTIRMVMMPKDTNPRGFIFGGVILSHMDIAGAEEALKVANNNYVVTKVMREVNFLAPVRVGDLVSYYCKIKKIGHTSITVDVIVLAQRGADRSKWAKVTSAEIVYVAVDRKGKPTLVSK